MRRICIVTGTRAEYGLLYWLLREIEADPDLHLQLVVTGMHLSPEFGLTYRMIEADGFEADAKVEMLLSSDTAVGIAKAIGLGVIGFADAFERLAPDMLVVLGDRFEILAAVQAALVARLPVAHLHGGETTEGAFDESIRHAITKMAHFHFVATEAYRQRVIQLGEQPARVWNVGAPGLDHLRRQTLWDRQRLADDLGQPLTQPVFLVTYHPVTLEAGTGMEALEALLEALDAFPTAQVIITKANADTGGRAINQRLEAYGAAHPGRVGVYASLGQVRYLSALRAADVVIGNSSSGIIEAPAFQKPVVNIGARQQGRVRAASVIDVAPTYEAIRAGIEQALSPAFQATLRGVTSPYGEGRASVQIKERLKEVDVQGVLVKSFYDLED